MQKLKEPSTKDLAGQRLMLGFNGTELNDDLKHIIKDIRAGGIILFARNVQTPEQVTQLCQDCQSFAAENGLPRLIISVDQEGGCVARLKEGFTRFEGNPSITNQDQAENFARITATELKAVGITMNLAPVLDVAPDDGDSIMKDRVFPGDAGFVSMLGNTVIRTFQENGMMAVAKHFPGIGRTILDSHFHLPELKIDLDRLQENDLIPFVDAIESNVTGMMLSHIFYPQLDRKWQASLSPVIADELLRHQLGFRGLVMTDDLDMKAIGHNMETCIQQILKANIDMALICHKGPNIDIAAESIINFLSNDSGLYDSAKISYQRILKYKSDFNA